MAVDIRNKVGVFPEGPTSRSLMPAERLSSSRLVLERLLLQGSHQLLMIGTLGIRAQLGWIALMESMRRGPVTALAQLLACML